MLPLVAGWIGRQITVSEHAPPEIGLSEIQRETWQASLVVLDPRAHDDGQKIAVEDDGRVGAPSALLARLINEINARQDGKFYEIEAEPIFQPSSFWEFAERNRGRIRSITFYFVAPNMFGVKNEIDQALRAFNREEGVNRVALRLSSKAAINTDTDRIKHAVQYASQGAGEIRSKADNGEKYDSRASAKSVELTTESFGDRGSGTASEIARAALGD
jgi:hypothetical protein